MSLIITSNTALADEASTSVGLNAPSSYVNNLQGALRIPENAEIAVQSVKLSKTGNLTIPASGLAFGFYFGRNFDSDEENDMNISTSLMVPQFVGPTNSGEILNIEQIASESTKTFNKVLWHPNLIENDDDSINPGASCIVRRNASLDFVGFEFKATNCSSGQNVANKPTTFINTQFGSTIVPTFIGDVLTNPATAPDTESFIGTTFPLSLAGGSFNCSLGNSSLGKWSVGLSRCSRTTNYLGNSEDITTPSKFEGDGKEFYDYVVRAEPQGTNFVIKAYHCIADDDDDKLIMAEINYGTPIFGPTETIHEVIWEVKGERVACFLERTNGTSITLFNGTSATSASNAKPVNMMTRFLFPKVSLEVDKNVKIIGFNGVNLINFVYGDATANATSPDNWLYQDYYSYLRNNGTTAIAPGGSEIADQYELYNVNNIVGGFADQIGLSVGGLINYPLAGINLCFEDNYGLLEDRPDNPETGFVLSGNLNSAGVYGFEGNGTPNPPALTTPLLWTSSDIPVLKNTNSLFIRLKNMTFDSANFSVANMSKILYHIPAFSNNGESTGSLFFEPSERVYLKLNNPREFEMTTIEVDIVNSNETISRDLLGKTVVVFHIRQSK